MNCDRCGEEATVHDFKLTKGGISSQIHLCESCATKLGLIGKSFKSIADLLSHAFSTHLADADDPLVPPTQEQIQKALSENQLDSTKSKKQQDSEDTVQDQPEMQTPQKKPDSQSRQERRRKSVSACPSCGLTWSEFRDRSQFGCADCYDTFEKQLNVLLERAHEGGAHHVGKRPRRHRDDYDTKIRIQHLRKQLADAIAAEQYERAAQLRDEINTAAAPIDSPPAREISIPKSKTESIHQSEPLLPFGEPDIPDIDAPNSPPLNDSDEITDESDRGGQ